MGELVLFPDESVYIGSSLNDEICESIVRDDVGKFMEIAMRSRFNFSSRVVNERLAPGSHIEDSVSSLILKMKAINIINHIFTNYSDKLFTCDRVYEWLLYSRKTNVDYFSVIMNARKIHYDEMKNKSKSLYLFWDEFSFLKIFVNESIDFIKYMIDTYPECLINYDIIFRIYFGPDLKYVLYPAVENAYITSDMVLIIYNKIKLLLDSGVDPNYLNPDIMLRGFEHSKTMYKLMKEQIYHMRANPYIQNSPETILSTFRIKMEQKIYNKQQNGDLESADELINGLKILNGWELFNTSKDLLLQFFIDKQNEEYLRKNSSKSEDMRRALYPLIIHLLLQYGADPLIIDNLYADATQKVKNSIEIAEDPTIKEKLINYTKYMTGDPTEYDENGITNLMNVAKNGYHVILQKYLNHKNIKRIIDTQDENGNTALHYAISESSLKTILLLHNAGANMNKRNKKKITPFNLLKYYPIPREKNLLILTTLRSSPSSILHHLVPDIASLIIPYL